jgi:hypothetical protein
VIESDNGVVGLAFNPESARLFAAAPDLLAALKALVMMRSEATWQAARAAIRKAEGVQ